MFYNFNIDKISGVTYFEVNNRWYYVKNEVKRILDSKDSCRLNKIDLIICILEDYKSRYLTSKGGGKKCLK